MIKVLHLSDLHFCKDARANNMKNILLEEARAVKPLDKGEKLLIITGDFHNYFSDDYLDAEKFICKLVTEMGLEMAEDVFVIPGNHDVGNDRTLPPLLEKDDPNWKIHNKSAVEMLKNGDMSYIEERLRAFRPYCQFVQRLGVYDPASGEDYPVQAHVRRWRGKLNILHLNTALVADGKTKDNQMTDAATATADETWDKYYRDDLPALALGHNSFFDLKKDQQNALKAMFKYRNVSVYLCGDTHKVNMDDTTQTIALESGAKVNRLQIPNIVCIKGIAEDTDTYSDFGYYWHEWDTETDEVKTFYRSWKPGFGAETKHDEAGDGEYVMRRKNPNSIGSSNSRWVVDSTAVYSDKDSKLNECLGISHNDEFEAGDGEYVMRRKTPNSIGSSNSQWVVDSTAVYSDKGSKSNECLDITHNDELYYINIRNYLIQRAHAVRVDANRNLLTLAVLSEDFYAEFLNVLLDLQLKNANASDPNAKGIDLIDWENRVAVQVSVTCTPDTIRRKIRSSIQKFDKPEDEVWQFYFVPITDEAPKLKTDIPKPEELHFDKDHDVLDITRLLVLASENHKLMQLSQLVDQYSKKKDKQ